MFALVRWFVIPMDSRWCALGACGIVVAAAATPGASFHTAATCCSWDPSAAYLSRPARRPVSLSDRDRTLTLRGGATEGAGTPAGGRARGAAPNGAAGLDGSSAADACAPLAQAERVMQAAQARLAAKTSRRDQAPPSLADRRRANVLCPAFAPCGACPCAGAQPLRLRLPGSSRLWARVARLKQLHGARPQVDAYEQQRRALLDDAYSLASQGQDDEEEEDMEAVMEDLEKLSRAMAQFKELSHRQQERIERYARAVC